MRIGAKRLDQSSHARVGFERSAIDDQSSRNVDNLGGLDQSIFAQRRARRNQIDDPACKTQRRGKFHCPVQLDAFGLDALRFKMTPRDVGIFGRNPKMARTIAGPRALFRLGNRQMAMADIEIDGRIKVRIVEFFDHIGAYDSHLRRTMCYECRDIESANANQLHVVARRRKTQGAIALVVERIGRDYARLRHNRQSLVENTSFGNGEGEWSCHNWQADRLGWHKGQRKGNCMAASGIMNIVNVREGIEWQATHAEEAGAFCTARVIRALLAVMETQTAVGRRIAGWEGLLLADAMPLRIAGGLHNLLLTGADRRLEPVYAGITTDQGTIDAIVVDMVATYDTLLLPWFDGPPQTNEAGRSWGFMSALLWLSQHLGPNFAINELGASAGVNTMMDRYHFDLGGVQVGPPSSPMRICPEWRGSRPPEAEIEISSIRGCDQSPIDLSDPEAALRLKSYVWPEASARMGRIEAAIELAAEQAPDIVKQDAGDFVRDMLASPQEEGVTRVLSHSIVWQYIPEATREWIEAAMEEAGAAATKERPLAWIALETNRKTFRHELHVRYWPGGEKATLLGFGHPHGAWAEWVGS